MVFSWARRARGAWDWPDLVEPPLAEQTEAYRAGVGNPDAPSLVWDLAHPRLELSAATWATLQADHSGAPLWVRQIGSFSASDPLLLTQID
ncbi:hypothetical protein FHS61_000820 [Altererythrobacter atlanticus]|nr:hypothetical protein [Croceibacterium atlanticum]MBB5731816.1 hypothetical protein [Croceibacterium atlanticum]